MRRLLKGSSASVLNIPRLVFGGRVKDGEPRVTGSVLSSPDVVRAGHLWSVGTFERGQVSRVLSQRSAVSVMREGNHEAAPEECLGGWPAAGAHVQGSPGRGAPVHLEQSG